MPAETVAPPSLDFKASILVVDDRSSNLSALAALLEPLGQEIVLASSGREALRHILQREFAVILMDVQMPDMDGFETATLIRERALSRYIPIIFITAINSNDQLVFQGYSVGAVDYITKPFNPTVLISKVSVFVELYKKERKLKEQDRRLYEAELEALELKQREREREFEQEKIRAVNRMLEERVQERTAELEAFCYSVSHDLRAPLRSIHGHSSTLEKDLAGSLDESTRYSLTRIQTAAKKMDELISALLALSRITRAEVHEVEVNVSQLASSLVEEFRANEPGRNVACHIQEDMVTSGDPILLRCLLYNLIDNAWKFTGEKPSGFIEVGSYEDDGGHAVYFVKDNGIGFDPKYAHKLFQPFERLHGTDQYPGSGIGLATVLRIVRKHGGHVWATGEENTGAQFFFRL